PFLPAFLPVFLPVSLPPSLSSPPPPPCWPEGVILIFRLPTGEPLNGTTSRVAVPPASPGTISSRLRILPVLGSLTVTTLVWAPPRCRRAERSEARLWRAFCSTRGGRLRAVKRFAFLLRSLTFRSSPPPPEPSGLKTSTSIRPALSPNSLAADLASSP